MIRLSQAIVAVMSCTLAAGAAGGIVGAAVGGWHQASSAGFVPLEVPGADRSDRVRLRTRHRERPFPGRRHRCLPRLRARPARRLAGPVGDRTGPAESRDPLRAGWVKPTSLLYKLLLWVSPTLPADRMHQPLGLDESGGVDLVPLPLGGDGFTDGADDLRRRRHRRGAGRGCRSPRGRTGSCAACRRRSGGPGCSSCRRGG